MDVWVYINDRLIPGEEAKISALDLSVLRGYGVMDYLRTYGGRPFRLREHLERFQKSAEEIGLGVPKSLEEMTTIVEEMIARSHFKETSVKVVLTGGVSPDQYLPIGNPTFFAVSYPFKPFPQHYFEQGIKVMTESYARPFPLAKSTQYLSAIVAMQKVQKMGAVDVLFHTEEGRLLETGTANFFAVKEGVFLTPPTSVLMGVTRQVVLELLEGKFPVEEREIYLNEISTFDGAFLTSSNKEVMPVVQINEHTFSIPKEVRILMQDFANFTASFSKKSLQNI
ncbi:MAG: aminotransferase class IV [Chlamydiia bacterium]|nr:aminotransferase class IV [Chlamydiia bacterium]